MRYMAALIVLFSLGGCASNSLYQWGGYERALYSGYKDPTKMEELRVKLETLIADTEKTKQKVAPGLYAELGTLYLQSGSIDKAIGMYSKERDAWPESKQLMTAMIQNLERRQQAKLGEAK